MTPLSSDPVLHRSRVVAAVTVPDRAEWPVLAPGQVVFVRALEPSGANYFEQAFAVRLDGVVCVRHVQVFGSVCRVWARERAALDLAPVEGWPRPGWQRSGLVHPRLRLIGPAVYPYRHAERVRSGRPLGRPLPPVFYAWSN